MQGLLATTGMSCYYQYNLNSTYIECTFQASSPCISLGGATGNYMVHTACMGNHYCTINKGFLKVTHKVVNIISEQILIPKRSPEPPEAPNKFKSICIAQKNTSRYL